MASDQASPVLGGDRKEITEKRHFPLFIDGDFVAEGGGGTEESSDPATGRPIATFAVADVAQADAAVAAARRAFDEAAWRGPRPFERGRVMLRIAEGLLTRRDEIARSLTLDTGKPLRDAYWEVDCTARFFEFYGGYCDKIHGEQIPLGPGWMDWTVREPIGVSAHIVPWNYPLQVAVRGVAPALAAGCSVVIKPSMETPGALVELAEICAEAGLPAGTLNVVTGPGSSVGDHIAGHRDVNQLTFTGSVSAGIKVTQTAATHNIPVTISYEIFFANTGFETDNIGDFQDGIEVGGDLPNAFRWSAAVVKGRNAEDAEEFSDDVGKFDANLYLRVSKRLERHRLGAFAYIGRNTLALSPTVVWDDSLLRLGADANVWMSRLNLYGVFMYGRNDNSIATTEQPNGTGESQSFNGGFIQADYHARETVALTLRLNLVRQPDGTEASEKTTFSSLFPGVQFWLFSHVKLSFEYGFRNQERPSFGAVQAEVAF